MQEQKVKSKISLSYSEIITILLGITAFAAPGLAFQKVYLFHLFWGAVILSKIITKEYHFFLPNRSLYFFYATILWFILLFPFVENQLYAVKHLVYISLGIGLIHILVYEINDIRHFKLLICGIGIGILADIVICYGEIFGFFRYPISKFSTVSANWGFPNDLAKLNEQALIAPTPNLVFQTFMTTPTGFHYNPNQLSVVLLLLFPFVLLHKKWTFSLPFLTLIIGIITMASARIVFYTLIIVWLVSFFFVQRKLILNYTYTAFLFIFVLTNCFLFRPLSYLQFNEISFPIWALFIDLPPKKCDNSGTTRKQLTIDGLNALKSNYGMGVGGGNAVCIQEKKAATKLPVIKELHNFWLELAVEGGLLYALLFAFFYVWWLYKLWHSAQLQNELFQYWGTSFFLGAVGLLFGGIAPSSCIYFLPMYLFVGLSLVFLKLCLYEDSIIG